MRIRRVVLWALVALLLGVAGWSLFSKNPFAQAFQEILGSQPDEPILKASFVLGPRAFRYYQFHLPPDSSSTAIVAHFTVSSAPDGQGNNSATEPENGSKIEVDVVSELAFSDWQRGGTANPLFATGQMSEGNFRQELPAGPGDYYVVFSNRFDSQRLKKVEAEAYLHRQSWLHR